MPAPTTFRKLISWFAARPFDRQIHKGSFDFAPDATHGNPENSPTALEQANNFTGRDAFIDGSTIARKGDRGEVVHSPVPELYNGGTRLLKGNSHVKEFLHDLQDENVLEGVEPLGAWAARDMHGRLKQASAGSVVEPTVGDAGCSAGHGTLIVEVIALKAFKRVAEEYGLPRYDFMGFGAH